MDIRTVILVEGESDRGAVEALARMLGRDLDDEGVTVLSMGGATNLGRFLDRYGPNGADLRLAGLCDAREARAFARALERAGLGTDLAPEDLERLGFFVCVEDLEDELIRALGAPAIEAILASQRELTRFRTFQRQPEWRDRTPEDQLRRFFGTFSGRKIRSAPLLVDALEPDRIPRPLRGVLARTLSPEVRLPDPPGLR